MAAAAEDIKNDNKDELRFKHEYKLLSVVLAHNSTFILISIK